MTRRPANPRRDSALALLAASICAGVVCFGLLCAEALSGFCLRCDTALNNRDDTWLVLLGCGMLACGGLALFALIAAIAARPAPLSPRGQIRNRRAKVAGAALAAALGCLIGGTCSDLAHHTSIAYVFELGVYASAVVAIAAIIATVFVRTPPVVPPAKVL